MLKLNVEIVETNSNFLNRNNNFIKKKILIGQKNAKNADNNKKILSNKNFKIEKFEILFVNFIY